VGGGKVLRISFGSDAKAVSSHLVNLKRLALYKSSMCEEKEGVPFVL